MAGQELLSDKYIVRVWAADKGRGQVYPAQLGAAARPISSHQQVSSGSNPMVPGHELGLRMDHKPGDRSMARAVGKAGEGARPGLR